MLDDRCRWGLGPGGEILEHRWKLRSEDGVERRGEGGVEQGNALEKVPEAAEFAEAFGE